MIKYSDEFVESVASKIANIIEEEREQNWRDFISKQLPYERKFKKVLQDLFEKQKKEVLANMKKTPIKIINKDIIDNWLFGRKEWEQEFFRDMQPIIFTSLATSGTDAMLKLGIGVGFDVEIPEVRAMMDKFIKEYVTKASIKINETTSFFLREELKDGLKFGESMEELSERVYKVYGQATRTRSMIIARTETIRSSNAGNIMAWKQSGVVEGKEYYTALDERVCFFCSDMHGKTIGLDEHYFELGDELSVDNDKGEKATIHFDYSNIDEPPIHPRCLINGQASVLTINGWELIRNIKIGDFVFTHKGNYKPVLKVLENQFYKGDVIEIFYKRELRNKIIKEKIAFTPEHPVLTKDKWVSAENIRKKDYVYLLNEKEYYGEESCRFDTKPIVKIKRKRLKKAKLLYNLSVQDDKSYIIKGMVVHNCRCTLLPVMVQV